MVTSFCGLHGWSGLAFADLVDQREDALLDEFDQAFEHLRLAGEVAVQGRFAHIELGGQRRGGDALGARLLEHGGQRLQDLHAALTRLGTLAHRRLARNSRPPTHVEVRVGNDGVRFVGSINGFSHWRVGI
jgi:hypothetical protein